MKRFLLPNEVCAVIVATYGLAGVAIYGPFLSEHSSAERVQALDSADYLSVLSAHLLIAAILAAPSLIGKRRSISFQISSRNETYAKLPPSYQTANRLKQIALLALTPAILMIAGFQDLLLSRPGYLTGPRFGVAFKLGSPSYTAGVLVLVGCAIAITAGKRFPVPLQVWFGLTLYLMIGVGLGTREVAVPAAAITYLLARNYRSRIALALVPLSGLFAISLALNLRGSSGGHGLIQYLPLMADPRIYFDSASNGIANALNGFHGSGAAMHEDFYSPAGGYLLWSLLNPFDAKGPHNSQSLLDFGTHFPIPTLGFVRSLGLKYVAGFFGAAGAIFNILGRLSSSVQDREFIPLGAKLAATSLSYGLAALFSIFTLQYKLHQSVVPLKMSVILGAGLLALIFASDAAFELKQKTPRVSPLMRPSTATLEPEA